MRRAARPSLPIVAALAWSSTTAAPARAGVNAPIRSAAIENPAGATVTTGLTAFGTAYAGSVFAAAASRRSADDWLLVPLAGPWLDLRASDCRRNDCPTILPVLLVADGLLQAGGVVLVAAGTWAPTTSVRVGRHGETVELAPARLARDAWGLTARGRF